MIDQVKYFAKLSGLAAFTLVKLYAVGLGSTVISLILCVLIMTGSSGAAVDADGATTGWELMSSRTLYIVFAVLIVAGGVLLALLANKYTVSKVINRILTDKGEPMLVPFLDKAIEKFRRNRPASVDRASDTTMAKMRLVQEARNGSGNRWTRSALALAFKTARLDDVDFTKDDTRMGEVVRDRTMLALREMSRPGKTAFWAVIAVQWLLALVAWVI